MEEFGHGGGGEGAPSGEELVGQAAEGVEVGAVVDGGGAVELFGGHEGGGADHGAAGQVGGLFGVAGDAEVEDFGAVAVEEHDVGGFDVAVHHAFVVGFGERVGDLGQDRYGAADGESLRVAGGDLGQVGAVQQLHDQEQRPVAVVITVVGVDVEQDRDAGVLEAGGDLGLAAEPCHRLLRGAARGQCFDCDGAVEAQVVGPPHLAHAAAAEGFVEPVPSRQPPPAPHAPPRRYPASSPGMIYGSRVIVQRCGRAAPAGLT